VRRCGVEVLRTGKGRIRIHSKRHKKDPSRAAKWPYPHGILDATFLLPAFIRWAILWFEVYQASKVGVRDYIGIKAEEPDIYHSMAKNVKFPPPFRVTKARRRVARRRVARDEHFLRPLERGWEGSSRGSCNGSDAVLNGLFSQRWFEDRGCVVEL